MATVACAGTATIFHHLLKELDCWHLIQWSFLSPHGCSMRVEAHSYAVEVVVDVEVEVEHLVLSNDENFVDFDVIIYD